MASHLITVFNYLRRINVHLPMRIVNLTTLVLIVSLEIAFGQQEHPIRSNFNLDRDLLLVHYDCKTDVDDLHSVAAFATLLRQPAYSKLQYHAVAGTYGIQKGLYVPPNDLFALAFGNNWSDAHNKYTMALTSVSIIAENTLKTNGTVWISEAGQSDFSADLLKMLQIKIPNIDTKRIHVVQHSDWNEKTTTPEKLDFVKSFATYHKIPDGNVTKNGTPGFRSEEVVAWSTHIKDKQLSKIWKLAVELGNQYNGKEERYLNKAIEKGGLDFSDFAEVCWILGLEELEDAKAYFEFIAQKD